jgi:PQQ-dependent catabolism-associated CXXCW motif protein
VPGRLVLLLALLLLSPMLAAAAGRARAPAPQPRLYWTGPDHGSVPAAIAGGTVIHTAALASLLRNGGVLLVDVAKATRRPSGLPAGTIWMPPPHFDIPGSIWIPGAGEGAMPANLDAFFRARLKSLTGGDRNRKIVVYCHPQCWLSWNAAKRAISYGYRHVYWYPDGMEGWRKAGHPTAVARPEGPRAG